MLWLYAVAFLLSEAYSTTAPNACPEITSEDEIILLPHETDCTKFYECSWGKKVLLKCPENLHFNPEHKECDWPEDAGCNLNATREKQILSVIKKCPLQDPGYDVLLPHETDCGKFYKCHLGVKFVQDCPEGMHFNSASSHCDWYLNAGCKTPDGDNRCPIEDKGDQILLPHPTDCTKFLHCTHGQPLEKSCPPELFFNPDTKTCDWPWNVKCPSNTKILNEDACLSSDVLLPHESNCTKFYRCEMGRKTVQNCPRGLHFNTTKMDCDWPKESFCSKTFELSECSADVEDFLPHEYDCRQFYICLNGGRQLFMCPPGLYFDLESNNCEDLQEYPCEVV